MHFSRRDFGFLLTLLRQQGSQLRRLLHCRPRLMHLMFCPFGTTERTRADLSSTAKRTGASPWKCTSPNWLQVWRRIRLITMPTKK